MMNKFLPMLGFEVGYPPVLVNKQYDYCGSCHTKDDKTI